MELRIFLQTLAEARAEPSTSTRAICMEKASRPHMPSPPLPLPPQAQIISQGLCCVPRHAAMKTTIVRMMANRNGSGSHRFMMRTHPLENFFSINFPPINVKNLTYQEMTIFIIAFVHSLSILFRVKKSFAK